MLIYEKKVNGERHIFGTTANVPSENDNQLEYYDLNYPAESIEPTLNDTYLDDGHGGIIQKSTGIQILSQFEDSEGNYVLVVPQVKPGQIAFILANTRDFLTEYVVGEEFDLNGLVVYAIKGDGSQEEITDYTTNLEDGHIMTLEDTELKVMWNDYYTIVPLTVSEAPYMEASLKEGVTELIGNFNISNFNATVYYPGDTTKVLTSEDIDNITFNPSYVNIPAGTEGTVTITYNDTEYGEVTSNPVTYTAGEQE